MRLLRMSDPVYNEPSKVKAKDGTVVVDGPDGVDVHLTPEAAIETSDRLYQAAAEAGGQRIMARPEKLRGSTREDTGPT